jgi:hypothetical protein
MLVTNQRTARQSTYTSARFKCFCHHEGGMIDSLLNLLFRCSHQRLSRPVTPVARQRDVAEETYVVCLDCGKRFSYDTQNMRLGKRIVEEAPPPPR